MVDESGNISLESGVDEIEENTTQSNYFEPLASSEVNLVPKATDRYI